MSWEERGAVDVLAEDAGGQHVEMDDHRGGHG